MKTIMVGCGGSGIKTLMRVNELLSEDAYWRYRIDSDIYYILIDTEISMLQDFKDAMAQQMHGATGPVIKTIQLSKSYNILGPLVHQYFIKPFQDDPEKKGQDKLLEHWWHQDGKPFAAPFVRPLSKGAGQCPPASYFLAWKNLNEISEAFDDVVKSMIKQSDGQGGKALDDINFFIVTGLAGGTGRGCWELISFKVRQLFRKYNVTPAPLAVLFDGSCFPNVYASHPEQKTSMKVNSLTGISELSCWLKNIRGATRGSQPFKYQLPDMTFPDRKTSNVLSVDLEMDANEGAPVDNAYLIFDRSDVSILESNDQYHEMVGTALYAAVTKSSIQGERINSNYPYLGLAAASFEVGADSLRKYFEGKARMASVSRLLRSTSDADIAVASGVEEFFKLNKVMMGLKPADWSGFKADPKGNVLQRACHNLIVASQNEINILGEALEADNPEEVAEAVKGILTANSELVAKALRGAADDLEVNLESYAKTLKKQIRDVFRKTQSIASVESFLARIRNNLETTLGDMPAQQRSLDRAENPEYLVEDLAGREYKIWGRHYNEAECEELLNRTQYALLNVNYSELRAQLEKVFKPWLEQVKLIEGKVGQIRNCLERSLERFNEESKQLPGMSSTASVFEELFTDPERLEKGIPHKFSAARFYKRKLKPLMDRDGGDLRLAENSIDTDGLDGLFNFLLGAFDVGEGTKSQELSDMDMEGFAKKLEAKLRESVSLKHSFMEDNFSILNVVSQLRNAWQKKFNSLKNDSQKLNNAVEQFSAFFGVRPERDGKDYVLPEPMELIKGMAASLAATCKPFWMIDENENREKRVAIFIPMPIDDKVEFENDIKGMLVDTRPDVFALEKAKGGAEAGKVNPYVILAYSTGCVDDIKDIRSLDYWSQDPNVVKWLMRCEDEDGESVFNPEDNNKGIGYTDPLYVRNPEISAKRWKPWISSEPVDNTQIDRALDAMLYAFMEVDSESRVGKELKKVGWELPLLVDTGAENFAFTRKALVWSDDGEGSGTSEPDASCVWIPGKKICQSVWQLYAGFGGRGQDCKSKTMQAKGLEWCERIRQERDVFLKKVAPAIGCNTASADYKNLVKALNRRLSKLRDEASPDDAKIWQKLINRAKTL